MKKKEKKTKSIAKKNSESNTRKNTQKKNVSTKKNIGSTSKKKNIDSKTTNKRSVATSKEKTVSKKESTTKKKDTTKSKAKKESTTKKKVSEKGKKKPENRYRVIQKLMSEYIKKNNIKLSGNFNKIASEIMLETQSMRVADIKKNFNAIFDTNIKEKRKKGKIFPDDIKFFDFPELLLTNLSLTDNTDIRIIFKDGLMDYDDMGDSDTMWQSYTSDLMPHLRKYYDKSPVAYFTISEVSEDKSMVVYIGNTDSSSQYDESKGSKGVIDRFEKESGSKGQKNAKSKVSEQKEEEEQEELTPFDSGFSAEDKKAILDKEIELERIKTEKAKSVERVLTMALENLSKGTISQSQFDAIINSLGK